MTLQRLRTTCLNHTEEECEVWAQANMNYSIMKNHSDRCQQIHDIQARKVVPFPAGLRMFVPGQGFGLPLYHVPSTKSTCNEAVTNEPANINETDTANILASNDTCKTPQMYLLHSKGHLLGEFWSKAWSISPRLSTQYRGPITRRIWILHPMSDIRRDKKRSSCSSNVKSTVAVQLHFSQFCNAAKFLSESIQ